MKLVQKHLLKGTREFELRDDEVRVRITSPFKKKELSVPLAILNPEPVINKSELDFHSRVKCGPMFSLLINKPDPATFQAFVDAVKAGAQQQFNDFAGIQ